MKQQGAADDSEGVCKAADLTHVHSEACDVIHTPMSTKPTKWRLTGHRTEHAAVLAQGVVLQIFSAQALSDGLSLPVSRIHSHLRQRVEVGWVRLDSEMVPELLCSLRECELVCMSETGEVGDRPQRH